jgi:DNA topoisomerase-1
MKKSLIIVESPTKAKTINKFLGDTYIVLSSYGHIRDLPKGKLGIDIENDFAPSYVIPKDKQKNVTELKNQTKKASGVLFATDEDREGEAIAWHLANILEIDPASSQRIVFHEITEEAIKSALANPRQIDLKLVNAQQARRILDRLVGYKLSPFLWKKVARGLSAGRVQSVALRLIVEREKEINAFVAEEYWTIEAELENTKGKIIARLFKHKDKTLNKFAITNELAAQQIIEKLKPATYTISAIERKEIKKNPYPPFTTSTLQQAANRILGFSAKQTMVLAQQLYEGIKLGDMGEMGLITYMRTDSLNLAEKFIQEAENYLISSFGKEFSEAIRYKTKSQSAQEAHEAIRPTTVINDPETIKDYLNPRQFKLYDLIWKRAVASQMKSARLEQTSIDIQAGEYTLRSSGSVITFAGWLKIYPDKIQENILPPVAKDDILKLLNLNPLQHFTQPPGRFSEAGLVKALEEKGIGRPSTYAPTISTLVDRNYVLLEEKKLKPTDIGILVTDLLVEHFPKIVDYNFTAQMENELDEVAQGQRAWPPVIADFYTPFAKLLTEKEETISKKDVTSMREVGVDPVTNKPVSVRLGRFGPYVQLGTKDDEVKPKFASLLPGQSIHTISLAEALALLSLPRTVGQTEAGEDILASQGRFGPYLKVGTSFTSIKNENPLTIDEATARRYLQEDAEKKQKKIIKEFTGSNIKVLFGRYGAYITDGISNARIPKDTKPEELELTTCENLLTEASQKPKFKRRKKS